MGKTDAAIAEWEVERLRRHPHPSGAPDLWSPECLCGKRDLVQVYTLKNKFNGNLVVVGSCCVRRWQIAVPGWRGKRNYLLMALLMVRNDREREFVKGLLNKCIKYERGVILTQKQKSWLESITGHVWRGRLWK